VLLAALAHPDHDLRNSLLRRLDALIESRRPLHSRARALLALSCLPARNRVALRLDPLCVELALRVLRLVFAKATPRRSRRWLHIEDPDSEDAPSGVYLNAALDALEVTPGPRRRHRKGWLGCRLDPASALAQCSRFGSPPAFARAVCRARDGFSLAVQSGVSWADGPSVLRQSRLVGGKGLEVLGLTAETVLSGLVLSTTTPESIIQFSACLARETVLCLSSGQTGPCAVVFVALRDFDGDEGEMPAVVGYRGIEGWVAGLPALPLELSVAERVALARWGYAPESWLTAEVLGALC
jgi:hypothetical protein